MCRYTIITVLSVATLWSQPFATVDSMGTGGSKSLAYYESILKKYPGMPEAKFGAGHAAYEAEDYERASSEFKSVTETGETDLKSESYYNLGNTLHQQGQMEESLAAFRQALKLSPNDLDAKYNYEFTKRLMEQMQQQPDQSKQEQEDGSGDDQEQQQKQPQDQSQAEKERLQNQPPQSQPKEAEGEAQKRKKPDAETILDALKADEENLMKRLLSQAKSKKREKDW